MAALDQSQFLGPLLQFSDYGTRPRLSLLLWENSQSGWESQHC